MYYLFLDDERNPADVTWVALPQGVDWVIVRTQSEFEETVLRLQDIAYISFDNDLGDGCGEGRYCAKWLVDQWLDGTIEFNPNFTFTVHSKNNVAAEWIEQYINAYFEHRNAE